MSYSHCGEQIMACCYWKNVLSLCPGYLNTAFGMLTMLFVANELLKSYLMVEHTTSRALHIFINVLTLLPAIVLVALLLYAGHHHPDRVKANLLFAVSTFIPWYIASALPKLARKDMEGADPGFMAVGLILVLVAGLVTIALA